MLISRLRKAAAGWSEDQASQMGAALAYYTLFSFAPLLMLAIAIVGVLYGQTETKEQVLSHVQSYVGVDGAEAVRQMLDNIKTPKSRFGASAVGLLSLLFGSSGMFLSLRSSLNRIWRVPPVQEHWLVSFLKSYLLATLMVFLASAFFVVLLVISAAMPLLHPYWDKLVPQIPFHPSILDFVGSVLSLWLLFAFTFRFLSDGQIRYSQVGLGAFVTAVLFAFGKVAIGFYLAYSNLGSAFGAAGSLVVFLAWVYYSAQILFFGAEVIRFGLPTGQSAPKS